MARKYSKNNDTTLGIKVPVTSKERLEQIYSMTTDQTRTEILVQMIHQAEDDYRKRSDERDKAAQMNRKQRDFTDRYIHEHYGTNPDDEEIAQSEALRAYYAKEGYSFDPNDEEESFILPE